MAWMKQKRKRSNVRNDAMEVAVQQKGFAVSHGCHFTPKAVDIYTEPLGAGRGIRIALVPCETGEFKLFGPGRKEVCTDYKIIHCKELITDLKCLRESYPAHHDFVNGAEALIFTVKVESTLGRL